VATSERSDAAYAPGLILYFDPDGNHKAIAEIADLFNDYLKEKKADLRFQPVVDEATFESLLGSKDVQYSIVFSEYLQRKPAAPLRPILVPVRRNSWFYTKVLVDLGKGRAGDLTGDVIMTARGQTSEAEILKMLESGKLGVEGTQVVMVKSDINAAFAVASNQADAALVTQESIDAVLNVYVNRAPLRRIFETPPILRPPLCAVGKQTSEQRVKALFLGMKNDAVGRKVIAQLRIDDWVPYVPGMEKTK
jgi:ABC-type phosphate/phosphonate transport system substrate-binding protein